MNVRASVYVGANTVGLFLYAYYVWNIQGLIQAEQRQHPDGVDSMTFVATALPVLAFFVLVNLAWAFWAGTRFLKTRDHGPGAICVTVVACWIAAILTLRVMS